MRSDKQLRCRCPKGGDWIFTVDDEGSLLIEGVAADGYFIRGGLSPEHTQQVLELFRADDGAGR